MIALIQRSLTTTLLLLAAALAVWAVLGDRPILAVALLLLVCLGHAGILALEMAMMHAVNAQDPAPRATLRQLVQAWASESLHAPLVFCWRQPFRSDLVPDLAAGHAACRVASTHPTRPPSPTPPSGVADRGATAATVVTAATAATAASAANAADAAEAATIPADLSTNATPSGRGVLLIHGFVCNRGLWNRWLLRLRGQGVPFVAVNLEPVFGSIDDYVEAIERAVARLEEATGRPPVVVAHSMGGLALRRWWCVPGNRHRIARALTLGSPHQGTWLARLAMSPNARQMQQRSAWLGDLQRRERPETRARLTCFYSNADNIVFPASSATLAGADNRLLPGIPHVAMADDPRPWVELQRLLAAG